MKTKGECVLHDKGQSVIFPDLSSDQARSSEQFLPNGTRQQTLDKGTDAVPEESSYVIHFVFLTQLTMYPTVPSQGDEGQIDRQPPTATANHMA